MLRSSRGSTSSGLSRRERIERDLATMSPGQRRFFELVIGITHALFVPVWLCLCAGWAWRCLRLTRARRPPGSPRPDLPPLPDFGRLDTSGYWLYLAGAYIAVVLGLLSMIGLCFLPVLTIFWVFSTLQEEESSARALLGTLGAAGLEALMLWVYFRYMRGVTRP